MTAPATTQSTGIDFSELHARHSRAELRAFKKWARSTSEGSHRARDFLRSIVAILGVGVTLLLIALFTAMIIGFTIAAGPKPVLWVMLLPITAFGVLASVKLIGIWKRDVRFGPRMRRWMRMDRFTLANRMIYVPEILAPPYEGSVFTVGAARLAYDVVATTTGRYVEIGNYQYRGETGLDRSLNRCGYVRIEADRRLPHLYLRSRKSGWFRGKLGATFARSQELSLEGNFGEYFRLYTPGGYERDALYILTPDLMAALIDHAAHYDVEFVDDYVYFYARRPFALSSESTYLDFGALVESVINKALKPTGVYSDFRVAGNAVTTQGARLVPGVTVAAVVGILIVVAQVLRLLHVF